MITSHASGEEIYRVLMWCTPDSDTSRRSHAVNKAASEDAGTFCVITYQKKADTFFYNCPI